MTRNRHRRVGGRQGDLLNKLNVTLMMILLAFFIVLNSLSVPNEDRHKSALGSLIGTLGILPGGPSPMQGEKKGMAKPMAPMLKVRVTMARLVADFEKFLIEQKAGEKTTIITHNGLELTMNADLLFRPRSAQIKPSAVPLLDKMAAMFQRIDGSFVIEGYTDDRPIKTARYPGNIDFSIAQAGAVAGYLVKRGGIKPAKLGVSGYGARRPLFPNDTLPRRIRNNRIRIVYRPAI